MVVQPSSRRREVISTDLRERLRGYLGFRHVFRQGYSFLLTWPRMADLVARCDETLGQLETELRAFFASPPR